jgi:FkbM family methyltransferase
MLSLRRFRFEITRRLNQLRPSRDYRWTNSPRGDRVYVILCDRLGAEREFELRGGGSDLDVFIQIFDQHRYDTDSLQRGDDIRKRYSEILAEGKVSLSIDAGASVGLSAAYFRDRYPKAQIVALEPEPSNFAKFLARAGPLTEPLQAALAGADGRVNIVDPGLSEWGFRTRVAENGVPAHSLASLLERYNGEPLVLKIDIEGRDSDSFHDPELLDRFYVIFFKPHYWLLPRQRPAASFLRSIAQLDRDFLTVDENVVSIANR